MTPLMIDVVSALSGKRFPLEDEKRTQAEIEKALRAAFASTWVLVMREVAVVGGIIDFAIVDPDCLQRIGIEVKIKGTAANIVRQVSGYLEDRDLHGLLLVTSKPVHLPSRVNDKPVAVFDLGRAWL